MGVNAYHGDASAALLRDGTLLAAVEEERFLRVKHWAGFPRESIQACLKLAGIQAPDIDYLAIARDPSAHLWRKALFALRSGPAYRLVSGRLRNQRQVGDFAGSLASALGRDRQSLRRRVHWVEHHRAHLASAFYVSPFEGAAVCAIDGFGDFVSTSWGVGEGKRIDVLRRVYFPHSLGLLYLAVTQFLGFTRYGDEYKVMGLAPYGEPRYIRQIRNLIHLLPGGSFELDLRYFRHHSNGTEMTWEDCEPTIGQVYTERLETVLGPSRRPDEQLEARHEDVAASLQAVFEETLFHVLNGLYERTRSPRLCLAGGCAMNSVANGKIRERTSFREIFIQPAAGDNGAALGAALHVAHGVLGKSRGFVMEHAYWGPEFSEEAVAKAAEGRGEELTRLGCNVERVEDEDRLCGWTAQRLAEGKIAGWFQGRMEWGSRALGNRSILADPRRANMREIINSKIKFREKFRPFAPSILEEAIDEYFVNAVPDPFMIQVYSVRPEKRHLIPAVTHVDGSGRLHTVGRSGNPLFWYLIKAFEKRTGVPVLLNTSFNENEPIVHLPGEGLDCFLRTRMDVLVMGHYVFEKR